MSKFSIAFRLFVITAVSTLLLSFANHITAPITEKNQLDAFNASLAEALPSAKEFKPYTEWTYTNDTVVIESVNKGYADKEMTDFKGYVVKATSSEGYGGKLGVIIGIDKDFKVTKVIISSPFSETPGLGAKAKDDSFLNQFKEKTGKLKLVKRQPGQDSEIQALTSATITSTAVTNCVNAALEVVSNNSQTNNDSIQEAKDTVDKIQKQSDEEKKAVEKSHENEATPIIADEADEEQEKDNDKEAESDEE